MRPTAHDYQEAIARVAFELGHAGYHPDDSREVELQAIARGKLFEDAFWSRVNIGLLDEDDWIEEIDKYCSDLIQELVK